MQVWHRLLASPPHIVESGARSSVAPALPCPLCRGPRLVVRSAAMSTLVSPAADAYFRAGAAAPWAPRHR